MRFFLHKYDTSGVQWDPENTAGYHCGAEQPVVWVVSRYENPAAAAFEEATRQGEKIGEAWRGRRGGLPALRKFAGLLSAYHVALRKKERVETIGSGTSHDMDVLLRRLRREEK